MLKKILILIVLFVCFCYILGEGVDKQIEFDNKRVDEFKKLK